jgi:hypothetical protein
MSDVYCHAKAAFAFLLDPALGLVGRRLSQEGSVCPMVIKSHIRCWRDLRVLAIGRTGRSVVQSLLESSSAIELPDTRSNRQRTRSCFNWKVSETVWMIGIWVFHKQPSDHKTVEVRSRCVKQQ